MAPHRRAGAYRQEHGAIQASHQRSPHERQVATPEHDQEVRQVDQGEARREARRRPRRPPSIKDTPRGKKRDREPLRLGVIGSSAKENERRLPLHPDHLARIPADLRQRITLEHGYGARFRYADAELADTVAGLRVPRGDPRGLRRRTPAQAAARGRRGDAAGRGAVGLAALRPGPRADPAGHRPPAHPDRVRGDEPLDRRRPVGLHVFHKNNELAGYCSVLHALELTGSPATTVAGSTRW